MAKKGRPTGSDKPQHSHVMTRVTHYHVVDFHNRGSRQYPYGRLYLTATNKGYDRETGALLDEIVGDLGVGSDTKEGELGLWMSNRSPLDVSRLTFDRATAFLEKLYPHLKVVVTE